MNPEYVLTDDDSPGLLRPRLARIVRADIFVGKTPAVAVEIVPPIAVSGMSTCP